MVAAYQINPIFGKMKTAEPVKEKETQEDYRKDNPYLTLYKWAEWNENTADADYDLDCFNF